MRIADRRQRLGVPRSGWISLSFFFPKRNKHNNTVRKTRHEAFLNSNFDSDWIKNTQEIRQWKSLKLDQFSYAECSREHFGLPVIYIYILREDTYICILREYKYIRIMREYKYICIMREYKYICILREYKYICILREYKYIMHTEGLYTYWESISIYA